MQAYKQWVAENGEEPILPRLNLSNDQLLFVSFAQVCYLIEVHCLYFIHLASSNILNLN